jgi:regulator of protease activity HflC (stomatin/prohibitin superfamily)
MFDPKRILSWLVRVCRVFIPIVIILERCAQRGLEAAFHIRGAESVPTNTRDWLWLIHGGFQTLLNRTSGDPARLFVMTADMLPWLGPTAAKLALTLPSLAMLLLPVVILGWFVKSLYDLPDMDHSTSFVLRSMFGKPSFSPYLIYREGGEDDDVKEKEGETLRNVGGPGSVLLEQSTAALFERAGKFTRVKMTPGVVKLKRFERIYTTVDLRPRVWPFTVSAMSKEGIPVDCRVNIHFQVNQEGGEDEVFRAATCTWVRGKHWVEDKLDWAGRVVISNTEGTLRSILARIPLNQLVPAQITHPSAGTRNMKAQDVIRGDIEQKLKTALVQSAPVLGVTIEDVCLGDIEVSDVVQDQWADIWRTGWRSWATEVVNEGKLSYREKVEDAQVAGQVFLLKQLGQTIQELQDHHIPITDDLVALRFMDLAETMNELPGGRMLPNSLIRTIEDLKRI